MTGPQASLVISSPVLRPAKEPVSRVWACIICFHVQAAALKPLVDALRDQVDKILLLDNSPESAGNIAALATTQVIYLPMAGNRGTAGAMNQAWQLALAEGATAMLSFDQDSLPAVGMVAQLTSSLSGLQQGGLRPAAVGPGKIDPRNSKPFRLLQPVQGFWGQSPNSPSRTAGPVFGVRVQIRPAEWLALLVRRMASLRNWCLTPITAAKLVSDPNNPSASGPTVEVDHLITSGCLIPADMYQTVGPFREELFLDYVDIEWSLRARALGYSLYTDPRTTMAHTIGDQVIQIAGRSLPVHKPLRGYLLVRNHLLLWRLPSTRLYWLLRDLRQVLLKVTLLLALQPNRLERLRCILLGVWHGLRQRGGPPG